MNDEIIHFAASKSQKNDMENSLCLQYYVYMKWLFLLIGTY